MSKSNTVEPVKLITGLIFRDHETYVAAVETLEGKFGPVQFESEIFDFTHTAYYEKEMGTHLKRCFISFEKPIQPDKLHECKLATGRMEKRFVDDRGARRINIDPGLVSLANLVLASTKDFAHRLYLGQGIYAEVAMLYENKTFTPLKWTYPDYQRDDVIGFLLRVRENLKEYIIALRQRGS